MLHQSVVVAVALLICSVDAFCLQRSHVSNKVRNGLLLPLPSKPFSCLKVSVPTRSYTTLHAQFNLEQYVSETLLPSTTTTTIVPSFVTLDHALETYTENKTYIILTDLSVRSLDDISPAMKNFPFWSKYCKKMMTNQENVVEDKFLFRHDVGDERVCQISLARIPLETYQKLDLAKRLMEGVNSSGSMSMSTTEKAGAGTEGTGTGGGVVVMMLSEYGEPILDPHMAGITSHPILPTYLSHPIISYHTLSYPIPH